MSGARSRSDDLAQVGLAARRVAADIVERIVDDGRMLDNELDPDVGRFAFRSLVEKDRALIRAIVATVLRRKGQIDDALSALIDTPLPAKARRVTHILSVAAAQILFMDVPDHAAVSLAVTTAAGDVRARPWKKLVNGVLRNLIRRRDDILAGQDAARLNAPDWLWRRWCAAYGEAATRRIAEMHLVEPTLDLTVRDDPERWAETLGATLLPTGSLRLVAKGRVESLDGYAEGAWWVQDAAAALPARLLGDVAGRRVADLCAAPGGKTAQLAAAGADVTAVDIAANRVDRLRANLVRLGLSAEIVTADLLDWSPPRPFDAILLDAPCTATGTIRRHPDIPLRKRPGDIAAIADTQIALLRRAVGWLAPGGTLVYCTCSLEPEEGEDVVEKVLAATDTVARYPVDEAEIGGLREPITAAGDLRTLPFHLAGATPRLAGLDGFYAARLRRAGD